MHQHPDKPRARHAKKGNGGSGYDETVPKLGDPNHRRAVYKIFCVIPYFLSVVTFMCGLFSAIGADLLVDGESVFRSVLLVAQLTLCCQRSNLGLRLVWGGHDIHISTDLVLGYKYWHGRAVPRVLC
ncbi:hypothetical protein T439DRAFT_204528 [Meredithblackwellia eburnea MCA 4105]